MTNFRITVRGRIMSILVVRVGNTLMSPNFFYFLSETPCIPLTSGRDKITDDNAHIRWQVGEPHAVTSQSQPRTVTSNQMSWFVTHSALKKNLILYETHLEKKLGLTEKAQKTNPIVFAQK